MNLATDALNIGYLCDLVFLQDFNRDLLLGEEMDSLFNLSEGALTESLGHSVASYNGLLLLGD
jgi:hypothetical protein